MDKCIQFKHENNIIHLRTNKQRTIILYCFSNIMYYIIARGLPHLGIGRDLQRTEPRTEKNFDKPIYS